MDTDAIHMGHMPMRSVTHVGVQYTHKHTSVHTRPSRYRTRSYTHAHLLAHNRVENYHCTQAPHTADRKQSECDALPGAPVLRHNSAVDVLRCYHSCGSACLPLVMLVCPPMPCLPRFLFHIFAFLLFLTLQQHTGEPVGATVFLQQRLQVVIQLLGWRCQRGAATSRQ